MVSRASVFTISLITFVVGLIIGLVVLGWWLWPVQWHGGSLDVLSIESQTEYLRAAIDSYTLNPDAQLARSRFDALKENKSRVLQAIYLNSGKQYPPEIEAFAAAVGGTEFLPENAAAPVVTPTTAKQPAAAPLSNWIADRPLWMTLCLSGLLVFLVAVLILLIVIRVNRKKRQAHSPNKSPKSTQVVENFEDAAVLTDTNLLDEQPHQIQDAEIPDWLKAPPEEFSPITMDVIEEAEDIELSEQEIDEIASNFPFGSFPSSAEAEQSAPEPGLDFQTSDDITPKDVDNGSFRDQANIGEETPEQTFVKFSGEIDTIIGMDHINAEKLEKIGINAPLLLLKKCADPSGRDEVSQMTGIDALKLLEWVNFVDILRIKSLTLEDAKILKEAGVDMIVELATRNTQSLHHKIETTGSIYNIFYEVPSIQHVENWIEQAKELQRIVTY